MKLENKVLISTEVAQFYKISHETFDKNSFNIFIDSRLCFNFKDIIRKLWPLDYIDEEKINQKLKCYKYKDYLKCYELLLPLFQYVKSILKSIDNGNYPLQLDWLDNNVEYWKLYTHLNNDDVINPLHTLESLLCLTALLENALANVYMTVSQGRKKAPHLLKELIISDELKEVFGWEAMIFLKILLGTPNSINLRNICWHGFPIINGIPDVYHSVLLLIIHSMGLKLNAIEFEVIFKRSQIKDYTSLLEKFPAELKCDNFNGENYTQLLENFYAEFSESYLPIWQKLLAYYVQKEYVRFVIVILPQIELILRLYYGQINQFNVEAKIDEYYITLDTIFETVVPMPNSIICNKLLDFSWHPSGEGCFNLMYDIFFASNNCRLRDKISHGEVGLEALNNSQLSSILLQLFLNLLLPGKITTLLHYESQLHLNCQTKSALLRIFTQLHDLGKIECIQLEKYLNTDSRLNNKVLIFQRPHNERALMLSLSKMTQNISQTLCNFQQSLEQSYNRLKHRELHSRQRQTLQNLSCALPKIFNYLVDIVETVREMFLIVQQHPGIILKEKTFEATRRFLNKSLTISENLLKYSNPDVNQWKRMLELCEKFKEYKQKYSINEVITHNNKGPLK